MKKRDIIFILIGVFIIGVVLIGLAAPKFKLHVQSINCINQMSAIDYGAKAWSGNNTNRVADNFLWLSNELVTPKILICPGEKIRSAAVDWSVFTTNNSSYVFLQNNMPGDATNAYF